MSCFARKIVKRTVSMRHFFLSFDTGGIDPDQKIIDLRMKAVKHKILVLSGKGGVYVMNAICIHMCSF